MAGFLIIGYLLVAQGIAPLLDRLAKWHRDCDPLIGETHD